MDQNDWRRDPIWQAVGTIVSVVGVLLAALALPNEVRALGVIIVLLGAVLCFIFLFKRPFTAHCGRIERDDRIRKGGRSRQRK